jgi:hypothetical protein
MRRSMLVFVCCLAAVFTGLIISGLAEAAPVRGKSAAKELLPAALRNIDIKDDFIPGEGKDAGVIQTITGHAVVARQDLRQAYFAAVGDRLYEKDVLFTLKNSRCRFKMHNEDVVTLGESTRLTITAFADDRNTQEKRSSFGMTKGKAMFYTLRLLKHKQAGMDVATPTAVAGVRGTKFGAEVVEIDESTNVYAFEGAVAVTATATGRTTTLTEGQGVNANIVGLGGTFATPPGVSRQFQLDTSIGPSDAIGLGTDGSAAGTDETPLAANGVDTSTLTQKQNTLTTVSPARPSTRGGYFVGMLSLASSYYVTLISETSQDFDSSNARATAAPSPYFVRVDGTGGSVKQVAELNFNGSVATGLPQPAQRTELGYNAYMEWGSWTQPNPMTILTYNYFFNNKGYYVWGDMTTNDQMSALAAANPVATYSGTAYGTVWSSGGGIDKAPGSFSMAVNFNTRDINNFQVWVGGVNNTGMSGGTGTITGSSFAVTALGNGCVNGTCNTGGSGAANGAFYGPNAEYAGGVWKVTNGLGGYANGMFQGSK